MLAALPYARRIELERRDPAARDASLAGLALMFAGLARAGHAACVRQLVFPAGGKPGLQGGFSFSVSHSPSRAACAVGAIHEIGIDVEDLGCEQDRARLQQWTATEASLKAAGRGVRDLREVRLDEDRQGARVAGSRYQLRELNLVPECIAHLATSAAVVLDVAEVGLDDDEVSAAVERGLRLGTQFE